jgi:hypothetical protein
MPVLIKIEQKADDSNGDQRTTRIISRRALFFFNLNAVFPVWQEVTI